MLKRKTVMTGKVLLTISVLHQNRLLPNYLQNRQTKVAILRDEGSNSDREMSSAFYMAGFEPWDIAMSDLLSGRVNLDDFRGLAAVGGFSYADVPESAKGWAATIAFNDTLKKMFHEFYNRPDTFSLGICNGCQLFGYWVGFHGRIWKQQNSLVLFIINPVALSLDWSTVKVSKSPSLMLKGMEDLVFGIHVDHGEGLLNFPDPAVTGKSRGRKSCSALLCG